MKAPEPTPQRVEIIDLGPGDYEVLPPGPLRPPAPLYRPGPVRRALRFAWGLFNSLCSLVGNLFYWLLKWAFYTWCACVVWAWSFEKGSADWAEIFTSVVQAVIQLLQ